MKKFKLAFIVAALISILSAFATRQSTEDEYAKLGEDDYELLDPDLRGNEILPGGWDCNIEVPAPCTYSIKPNIEPHDPLIDEDMEVEENDAEFFYYNPPQP